MYSVEIKFDDYSYTDRQAMGDWLRANFGLGTIRNSQTLRFDEEKYRWASEISNDEQHNLTIVTYFKNKADMIEFKMVCL